MSDNPFASAQSGGNQPEPIVQATTQAPKSAPGAVTLILIFCLILGIMGLVGTCMTGAFLAMQPVFEKMALEAPGGIEQKEFQKMNLEVQKKAMIPGLALAVVNLFVALMLVVGSVGGLRRKNSGRKLLGVALLMAIFYLILKIIVTIYTYVVTVSGLDAAVANYNGEADPAAMETMLSFGKIGALIGMAFGVLIPLAMLGFYIWAKLYLGRDHVVKYFEAQN